MCAAGVVERGSEAPAFRRLRRRLGIRRKPRTPRVQLLKLLPKGAVCAEIGTWRGDFAANVLSSTHPRQLSLVDPWEYREESAYEGALYGGQTHAGREEMESIYQSVVDRFRSNIERGEVVVKRMRSVDAAASFPDHSFDWVYIDGDHTYEAVRSDLEAYYRTVKPGGFLAGDDYGTAGWWDDGVTRAVDEFAARGTSLTVIGSQFLLRKP
jgi:methyltransferase family protein